MSDVTDYLQAHLDTFQTSGQQIESGRLSIREGGPRMERSLHH